MAQNKMDVFLSHNSRDKEFVQRLKETLEKRGLTAWLDKAELRPGIPWQPALAKGIERCKSVAVIVGAAGLGKWQNEEVQHALVLAAGNNRPVIGVLIPGAPDFGKKKLPWTIATRTVVDLRQGLDGEGVEDLIWGITGEKPKPSPDPLISPAESVMTVSAGDSWLEERVVDKLQSLGRPLMLAYAELFSALATDQPNIVDFDKLLSDLEEKQQEKRTFAFVAGYAGTGKSTFLLCLMHAQKERHAAGKSNLIPIFLNLRFFLGRSDARPEIGWDAATELSAYIDACLGSAVLTTEAGILLIVDGCDEYYRHLDQNQIDTTLQDKVENLSARGRVVKVVGVGQGEDKFPGSIKAHTLKWAHPSSIIQLGRVKVEDENVGRIIRAYVHVNGYDDEEDMALKLERVIQDLKIPELDLFVLSLLETAVLRRWKPAEIGIGSLYFNYCMERVRKIAGQKVHTAEGARRLLKILAEATFQIYVPAVKNLDQVVQKTLSKYPEDAAVIPNMIAEIPHLHASVKEFLIAENAIELILTRDMPLGPSDGAIYPYGINRFVKSIINRSEQAQNEIFAKVTNLIGEAHTRQRIHLAYILGRFEDRQLRLNAKKLLSNLHESIKSHAPDYLSLDHPEKSVDARNWLLLQRTLYISLIYLGDKEAKEAAESYLWEMMEHPVCDNLNRGFHLQYYQDLKRPPESLDMIEPDSLVVELNETFNVLLDKLQRDLQAGSASAMSCVELHTLCSLCVNRHVIGELLQGQRERLNEFLKNVKAEDFHYPKKAWPYIEMAKDLLSRPSVSAGEIFAELHALKERKRAGWNATHVIKGIPYVRQCSNPESVSDHIWGTMMIASCFLPDRPPEGDEHLKYSKSRIMLMLLIHDLAETYLGDKPAFLKTDEDRAEEDRCMARIVALATLDVFNGVLSWRSIWGEWRDRSSINAQIASEVDAIESYVQMRRYLAKGECAIPDADAWAQEVSDKLTSTLGKKIFASLRHGKSGLLSWH